MSSITPTWNKRLLSSTRGQIIVLLRRSHHTVSELAETLGVTDNAVRAHLSTLERDGLVEQSGVKPGIRKPHFEYELTSEAELLFPKSLNVLFNPFLSVLTEQLPAEKVEKVFTEVAHRLASETAEQVKTYSPKGRAQAIVDMVSGLGGLAEVEEHPDHLLIHGISCPFAAIVCEHGDVCQLVSKVISEIAQAPVLERCDRGEKIRCYFEIEAK